MTEDEIRANERARIATILEDVAALPDTEPERGFVFQEIAKVLRIPQDELIVAALTEMCDEIRGEQDGNADQHSS